MSIKRNIKNDIKRTIRLKLYLTLVDNLRAIKNSVMDGFSIIEDLMEDAQTNIDFELIKEIFLEHLMQFEFLPESDDPNKIDVKLPSIDNFDFSDIEIMEVILNGIVGVYAEANAAEVTKLFGDVHEQLLHTGAVGGESVYLIPVTDDVILQEEQILGYSLDRFPFSDSPPIYDEFFGEVDNFIENNISNWISTAIQTSLKGAVGKYGGK